MGLYRDAAKRCKFVFTVLRCEDDAAVFSWRRRMSLVSQPEPQPLIVELEFPVRTYDIDFVGIVNNIVYIRWLEDLRLKILEEHLPLDRLLADGKAPVLAATEIEYIRPVRLLSSVLGRMWLKKLGLAKWTVQAEFAVNGVVMATARQTGVFVSTSTMKAVRIPQSLRVKFERAGT